jgi:hypothetical protein
MVGRRTVTCSLLHLPKNTVNFKACHIFRQYKPLAESASSHLKPKESDLCKQE